MTRKEELYKLVGNDLVLTRVVDELLIIEGRLDELKELPFIKIHPNDPTKQKATPAARIYKEHLQQYVNLVRILMKATGTEDHDEESPLRKWFRENVGD